MKALIMLSVLAVLFVISGCTTEYTVTGSSEDTTAVDPGTDGKGPGAYCTTDAECASKSCNSEEGPTGPGYCR